MLSRHLVWLPLSPPSASTTPAFQTLHMDAREAFPTITQPLPTSNSLLNAPPVLVTRARDPPQRGSRQPKWAWLSLNERGNGKALIKYAYTQGGACPERTPASATIRCEPVGCSRGPGGQVGTATRAKEGPSLPHLVRRGALLEGHTVFTGFLHCSHFR